ncbi:hypothetical protein ACFO5O_13150 [Geojedonia litorea]|uniref:Cellulase (Glycosyl hydrolase family 5) n=1 Tax=Geojedonia litorea TaxID=1268269 RepID=A0ABV9N612_9FLAO
MNYLLKNVCLPIMICFGSLTLYAQKSKGDVIVDKNGVMLWKNTKEEVKGFGVNYSVPFAHAYRSAEQLGIDVKQAIDNDIYHFTRLGFDLYRLHVWDTEISDTLGNLLENKHLDAFDYLLHKLKKHHINYVITPIAFWGNGWPEPDTDSPGFSHKYGKNECLTNPEAIKAQHNYLEQFLNHVNPYTGIAYKDEPNIIAFEVSNEPHHRGDGKTVTKFVKGMVDAMRKSGTKKPVFYNMSHAVQFMEDYFKGNVQGGTFQWYPTGLGYGKELSGNLLPNVNDYNMPFESVFKKYKGAKLVYEFDAADVGRSYIYPAMARSFRTAGIQIGTHFAYDPTFIAPFNTEYNTHYMNLNYTPQKALSLKICTEVFHEIPMNSKFGTYPQNTSFGDFTVDYKSDLAEFNSEEKFFYTNSTSSAPKNVSDLKEIAGFGNSSVVRYDGLGAYFLDKIEEGVWRLEVMPDAVWVDNPFGRNSLNKTVGVIKWETHQMSIDLNNLGANFSIEAINQGNSFSPKVTDKSFEIRPGTYVISKQGTSKNWSSTDAFKTNILSDFYAPESTVNQPWFQHEAANTANTDSELKLNVQFIGPEQPKEITVTGYNSDRKYFNLSFEPVGSYNYEATIPAEYAIEGFINYNILVKLPDDSEMTFPSGKKGNLYDWDFYDRTPYTVAVIPKENPILLFNAMQDSEHLIREWRPTFKLIPTKKSNEAEYQMHLDKLFYPDNENLNAEPIYDYSFKHFVIDEIKERRESLNSKQQLVFKGRSLTNKPCKLQIAFVLEDGSSFGSVIEIGSELKDYSLRISDLKLVKTVTLPRPYPSFLPYFFEHNNTSTFDIHKVESLQISIGSELTEQETNQSHGIGIVNVRLK